jgi:hypothetical protein
MIRVQRPQNLSTTNSDYCEELKCVEWDEDEVGIVEGQHVTLISSAVDKYQVRGALLSR